MLSSDRLDPPTPQLSVSQQARLWQMVTDRVHPDKIDAYLFKCGVDRSQLDTLYSDLNLRRSHLLACYKMKRNVRGIGVLVMLFAIGIPVLLGEQSAVIISIGLLVYGSALAITGHLTVFRR
jgi:hypothetical protein